jgi:osmotically-inducible protein OsmY
LATSTHALALDDVGEGNQSAYNASFKALDVNNSAITSKIKGSLLKDEGLKILKVGVKTNHDIVLLSGFIEAEDQID